MYIKKKNMKRNTKLRLQFQLYVGCFLKSINLFIIVKLFSLKYITQCIYNATQECFPQNKEKNFDIDIL